MLPRFFPRSHSDTRYAYKNYLDSMAMKLKSKGIAITGVSGQKRLQRISDRELRRRLWPYLDPNSPKSAKESIMIVDATLPSNIFGIHKFTKALKFLMTNRGVNVYVLSGQAVIVGRNGRHGILDLLDEWQTDPKLQSNFHMFRWMDPNPPSRVNFILIDGDTKSPFCLTSI